VKARPEESREMGVLGEGVYPSAPARGSGECCKLPQQGLKSKNASGVQQKSNFLHFSLKILHLVAPVLLICLRVITDHIVSPKLKVKTCNNLKVIMM